MSEPLLPFDARTLLAVTFSSSILMAAVLWFVFAGRFRDGLARWTQSLWVQADFTGRGALMAGVAAGAVVLALVAWLFARFSMKLPLGLFFGASAAFLAALAVVFAGKGIAALQAAGKLPMSPVGWPGVPALGVYPNWQGLLLQALILILIAAGLWFSRVPVRRG